MVPPEIIITSVKEVPGIIAREFSVVAIVVLGIRGEISGSVLFIFDEKSALRLLDILMGEKTDTNTTILSEINKSALKEVSSVMSGAYLRAMGEFTNITLGMVPPCFVYGASEKIFGFVNEPPIKDSELALCVKSDLIIEAKAEIKGYLVFFPSPESLRTLIRLLGFK